MSVDDLNGKVAINMTDGELCIFEDRRVYIISLKSSDIDAVCRFLELRKEGIKLTSNPTTKEEKELRKMYDKIKWRERHTKKLINTVAAS